MSVDVLIADDLAFIKMVLRDMVTRAGFRVVGEAADGEEAIEMYQQKKPDVLLLDITMPKMDGITALKRILGLDPLARVIMVSALGQQRLIVQAIQLGASDFIVKPFHAERLVSSVKKVLNIDG